MINFVEPGNVVAIVAPRALKSGDGFVQGKLFGINTVDCKSGAVAQAMIEGCVELVRAAGVTLTEGAAVNFDETTQTIVATGGKVIGYCIEAVSPDNAQASWVKLIPSSV